VWTTAADFADEEQKSELLAIRFANAESMYMVTADRGHLFIYLSLNRTQSIR